MGMFYGRAYFKDGHVVWTVSSSSLMLDDRKQAKCRKIFAFLKKKTDDKNSNICEVTKTPDSQTPCKFFEIHPTLFLLP